MNKKILILVAVILTVHAMVLLLLAATNHEESKAKEISEEIANTENQLRAIQDELFQIGDVSGGIFDANVPYAIPENNAVSGTKGDTSKSSASVSESPASEAEFVVPKPAIIDSLEPAPKLSTTKSPVSKPSTKYVRKPGSFTPVTLTYTGKSATGNITGVHNISLASSGILVNMDNHQVMWSKNPTKQVAIASLSKMMTMYLAYEISMDDHSPYSLESRFSVTQKAINTSPSKVDFQKDEAFSLRELLIAAAVKSANDAAQLIADHLGGGTDEAFIADMNRAAKELGMTSTRYTNPHGLPAKTSSLDNKSTVEDQAKLCLALMKHADLRTWVGTRSAAFREAGNPNRLMLINHNNLLPGNKYQMDGVNGIKTGFTNNAGYCVAASCERSGHNLLAIVTGVRSAKERDDLARDLLEWGYKQLGVPAPAKKTASTAKVSSTKSSTKSTSKSTTKSTKSSSK